MFRESAPFWLKARRGHMPYYIAAHGLYAQAIHEMRFRIGAGRSTCSLPARLRRHPSD
jgi:hypothetical protein